LSETGSAFIVALVSLTAMLLLGTAIVDLAGYRLKAATYDRNRMIALNMAEAGADYGYWRLYQVGGAGYRGETGITLYAPAGDTIGSFDVTVTTPVDSPFPHPRNISATGRAAGLYGQTRASDTVLVQVHLNLGAAPPSPAFDYAVFTEGVQDYRGGGSPSSPIVAPGNVHSNTALYRPGGYPRHKVVDEAAGYHDEGPNLPGYPGYIPFPELDLDYYRQYAQTDPGSHYYFGTTSITLPTAFDDVTFVEGLAGQTISLNVRSTARGTLIVIGGDVFIGGNRSFYGLIYIDRSATGQGGNYTMTGTSDVYGSIVARGNADLRGTLRAHYDRNQYAPPRLLPPTGPSLVAMDSWEEG